MDKRKKKDSSLAKFLLLSACLMACATGKAEAAVAATKAIPANSFIDSLGVNTHFNYYPGESNAYANMAQMETEMRFLGVRYARDNIFSAQSLANFQKMNTDVGTKFDFITSSNVPQFIQQLQANTRLIAEVEGPNEVDFSNMSYATAASIQKQLFTSMNATSALANFPVDSASLALNQDISKLGSQTSICDYSTLHIYPQFGGNSNVGGNISWTMQAFAAQAAGRAPVVTEFGWWTVPYGGGMPFDAHAKYMLNFFFDAFNAGIHRSYYYELNDEFADNGGSTIEYHFGLFTSTGAPKQAAVALRNVAILLADPRPLAATGSVAYSVSATNTSAIKKMLLQRGDGTFILALWQDPVLFNMDTNRPIAVATMQALVNLGYTAKAVQTYDPMKGTAALTNNVNIAGLTVQVPDHPIFVFFK